MIGRIGDWLYGLWLRFKFRKYRRVIARAMPHGALIHFKIDTRQAKRALKKLAKAERRAVSH